MGLVLFSGIVSLGLIFMIGFFLALWKEMPGIGGRRRKSLARKVPSQVLRQHYLVHPENRVVVMTPARVSAAPDVERALKYQEVR